MISPVIDKWVSESRRLGIRADMRSQAIDIMNVHFGSGGDGHGTERLPAFTRQNDMAMIVAIGINAEGIHGAGTVPREGLPAHHRLPATQVQQAGDHP